ncbi:ABC transporter permease [Vineibacter terrae]|uniref:ABC transporter permease n=1 Tax=Vineibacter terrae TaxID=2586908 RepID=UPI002E359214|nr:ABC transporter permease [Vineibacter terrae]HEX2891175.1 ABC transporter permease [Vineibacter terrae]
MRFPKKPADLALAVIGCLVIGFLLLPVVVVLPMSFNAAPYFEIIPSQPSFIQYERLFSSADWFEVLWRSVHVAALATLIASVVGVLAALGTVRLGARWRSMAEALLLSPQIIPSVVIAASAYYVFATFGLVGSVAGIALMHALLAVPFVVILVLSRLESLDPAMVQASASLGASPVRTFWLVTLPQLKLTLVASSVLAFHVSFDEVVVALFLSGARTKTLPVKLWDSILFEVSPLLPAISTVVVLASVLIVGSAMWLQRRPDRAE